MIIFCRGMYLTENTTQAASVRFVRQGVQIVRAADCNPFVKKGQSPFLTVSNPPPHHAEGDFLREKERIRRKIVVSRYEASMALSSEEPSRRTAVTRRASTILCYSEPVRFPGVGIPRVRGTAKRQALPPAFMRGEGHAVAGGVLRRSGESLLSHGFAVPAPPEGKPRALRTVLAPHIYEGGGPRSGRGSSPAAVGTAPLSRALRQC